MRTMEHGHIKAAKLAEKNCLNKVLFDIFHLFFGHFKDLNTIVTNIRRWADRIFAIDQFWSGKAATMAQLDIG